jgi:hypothetical protein
LDIFKTAPNRKRAWVGFSLMFGNQFTGVLVCVPPNFLRSSERPLIGFLVRSIAVLTICRSSRTTVSSSMPLLG